MWVYRVHEHVWRASTYLFSAVESGVAFGCLSIRVDAVRCDVLYQTANKQSTLFFKQQTPPLGVVT
jgi:hypothetical protein